MSPREPPLLQEMAVWTQEGGKVCMRELDLGTSCFESMMLLARKTGRDLVRGWKEELEQS